MHFCVNIRFFPHPLIYSKIGCLGTRIRSLTVSLPVHLFPSVILVNIYNNQRSTSLHNLTSKPVTKIISISSSGLFTLATCRWNLSRRSSRVPEVLSLSDAGTPDLNPAQSMDMSVRLWVVISDRAWSKNNRRRSIFSVLSNCGGAIATLLVYVNLPVF
jgi:hypothetical protein